jgi:hypothetical protein
MNPRTKKKALLSVLILAVLSTFLTVGTFALFTASTASPNNLFATGTVSLSNSNSAGATATLSNMLPGDSASGLVTVSNNGTEDVTSYALATSVSGGTNVLTTDATNGLQLWVARCSQAWTGSGASATCGGTQTDAVGSSASPVAITSGSPFSLGSALCTSNAAVTAAIRTARGTTCSQTGSDYLKVRVSLPSSAGNTFQGLSTTLTFTFQGSQATGASF